MSGNSRQASLTDTASAPVTQQQLQAQKQASDSQHLAGMEQMFNATAANTISDKTTDGSLDVKGIFNLLGAYSAVEIKSVPAPKLIVNMLWKKVYAVEELLGQKKEEDVTLSDHVVNTINSFFALMPMDDPSDNRIGAKTLLNPNFRNESGVLANDTKTDRTNRFSPIEAIFELAFGPARDAAATSQTKHIGGGIRGLSDPRDSTYDAKSTTARLNGASETYADAYGAAYSASTATGSLSRTGAIALENNECISFESAETTGQLANQHNVHSTEARVIYMMALAVQYGVTKGKAKYIDPIFGSSTHTFRVTQFSEASDNRGTDNNTCYCLVLDAATTYTSKASVSYSYFEPGTRTQSYFMNVLSALYNEPKTSTKGESDNGYFLDELTQTQLEFLNSSEDNKFAANSYADLFRRTIKKPSTTSTSTELDAYYDLGFEDLSDVFITNITDLTVSGTLDNTESTGFFGGHDGQHKNIFNNGVGVFGGHATDKFTVATTAPALSAIFESKYGVKLRKLFVDADGGLNLAATPLLFCLSAYNTDRSILPASDNLTSASKIIDAFLKNVVKVVDENDTDKKTPFTSSNTLMDLFRLHSASTSATASEQLNTKMSALLTQVAFGSGHPNYANKTVLFDQLFARRKGDWEWDSKNKKFSGEFSLPYKNAEETDFALDLFPNALVARASGMPIVDEIFKVAVISILSSDNLPTGDAFNTDQLEKAVGIKNNLYALADHLASLYDKTTNKNATWEKLITLLNNSAGSASSSHVGPLVDSKIVGLLDTDGEFDAAGDDDMDKYLKSVTLLSMFRKLSEGTSDDKEAEDFRQTVYNTVDKDGSNNVSLVLGSLMTAMIVYKASETTSGVTFLEKLENKFKVDGSTDHIAGSIGVGGKSYSTGGALIKVGSKEGLVNHNIFDYTGATSGHSAEDDFADTNGRLSKIIYAATGILKNVGMLDSETGKRTDTAATRGIALNAILASKKSLMIRFQLIQGIELSPYELLDAETSPTDVRIVPDFSETNNAQSAISFDTNVLLNKVETDFVSFVEYSWTTLSSSKEVRTPNGKVLDAANPLTEDADKPLVEASGIEDPFSHAVVSQVDLRNKIIKILDDERVTEDHVVQLLTFLYNNRNNTSNASLATFGASNGVAEGIDDVVEFMRRAISRSLGKASKLNRVPNMDSTKLAKKVVMWIASGSLPVNAELEVMLDLSDPVTASAGAVTTGATHESKSRLLHVDTKLADIADILNKVKVTPEDIAEDTTFFLNTKSRAKNHVIAWLISLKTDGDAAVNEQVDSPLKPAGWNLHQYERAIKLIPERELVETIHLRSTISTGPTGRVRREVGAYQFYNVDENGSFIEMIWDLDANSKTAGEAIEKPDDITWEEATEILAGEGEPYPSGSGLGETNA